MLLSDHSLTEHRLRTVYSNHHVCVCVCTCVYVSVTKDLYKEVGRRLEIYPPLKVAGQLVNEL